MKHKIENRIIHQLMYNFLMILQHRVVTALGVSREKQLWVMLLKIKGDDDTTQARERICSQFS
jgi:hypothetical protein